MDRFKEYAINTHEDKDEALLLPTEAKLDATEEADEATDSALDEA